MSTKSTETTVSKKLNDCDECVGRPENEEIEWNVVTLIQSQNNHPYGQRLVHLKDASIPFPLEYLLLKECFSLSNDVLQYVSKSSQIIRTVLTPEFILRR